MSPRGLIAAALVAASFASGAPTPASAAPDPLRARVAMQVELQKYGLSPDEARARVAGLSDDEVADLARNLTGFSSPREIAAWTGSAFLGVVVAALAMRRTRQEVNPAAR